MDLAWLVRANLADEFASYVKEAHAEAWQMFFKALGFKEAPAQVANNIVINVDYYWRKEVDLWVDNLLDYKHTKNPGHGYNL